MLDVKIQTFLAVCRTMSFTKAANELEQNYFPIMGESCHSRNREHYSAVFLKPFTMTPYG